MPEDPGSRSPAPPPSPGGAPYGTREVIAEKRLVTTEAPRDRQDKVSGGTAALVGAGEGPGARASSCESLHQQGPPGMETPKDESLPQQGPPGAGASRGKSFQQKKKIKDPGQRSPAPPPSSKETPCGASKGQTENSTGKGEEPSPRCSRKRPCRLRNIPT